MIAMCTGGSDEHMRPLPSFVTSTIVPVSATREVHARDPDRRREEPLAQVVAGERGQLGRVVADRAARRAARTARAPRRGSCGWPGR